MLEALRGAATSAIQHTASGEKNAYPNQGGYNWSFMKNASSTILPLLGGDASQENMLERVRVLHGELKRCLKELGLDDDSSGCGEGEEGKNRKAGGDDSSSKRHPSPTCVLQVVEYIRALVETVVYAEKCRHPSILELFCELHCLNLFVDISRGMWRESVVLQIQVLQSISFLICNITEDTSMFLLLSNNHINNIIDQERSSSILENEEFLAGYVSFLKMVSIRLTGETVQFFVNESLNSFPLFQNALPLLTMSNDTMVRTTAMSIILHLYRLEDPELHRFLSKPETIDALSDQIVLLYRLEYSLLLSHMRYAEERAAIRDVDCSNLLLFSVDQMQDYVFFINDLLCVNDGKNRRYAKYWLNQNEMLVDRITSTSLSPIFSYGLAKGPVHTIAMALEAEPVRKKEIYLALFVAATMLHLTPGSILSSHIVTKILTEVNIAVVSYLLDSYDEQGRLIAMIFIHSVQRAIAANEQIVLSIKERNDVVWIKLYSDILDSLKKHPVRQLSIIQLSCAFLTAAEGHNLENAKYCAEQALISAAVSVLGWMQDQQGCKTALIELRAAVADEISLDVCIDGLLIDPTLLLPPVNGSDATARSKFTELKALLLWLRFVTENVSVVEPDHTEVGKLSAMNRNSLVREDEGHRSCLITRESGETGTDGSEENPCDKEETLEEATSAVQKQKADHDSEDRLQGDNNRSDEACHNAADKAINYSVEYGHMEEDTKSTPSHHDAKQLGAIDSDHATQDDDKCKNPSSERVFKNSGVNSTVVSKQIQEQRRETELIQEEHPSSMLHGSRNIVPEVDISSYLVKMTASKRAIGRSSQSRWNATLELYRRVLGYHYTPKFNIGECIELKGKIFYPCMLPKGWPTKCPKGKTRLAVLLDYNEFYLSSTNVSVSSATIVCSIPYMLLWGAPHPMDSRVLELSFPSSSPPHLVPGSDLFLLGRPPGPGKVAKWTRLLLTLSSASHCSLVAGVICERHGDTVSRQCEMMSVLLKSLIEDVEGHCF